MDKYTYIGIISKISDEVTKLVLANHPTHKDVRSQQHHDWSKGECTLTILVDEKYYSQRKFAIYELDSLRVPDSCVESEVWQMYQILARLLDAGDQKAIASKKDIFS